MSVGRRPAGFDEAWASADRVPGWLTMEQARVLWSECLRLPEGAEVVEVGSHQGRSTLVLGAAAGLAGGRLTAVDPFDPSWRYGGDDTERLLRQNLSAAGLDGVVRVLAQRSQEVLQSWRRPLDLVYVDGKHDYWSVGHDLTWAHLLPPGRRLLVHDCFSSLGVTTAVLRHVTLGRELTYLGRVGSLALFERREPRLAERMRLVAELPWFLRNLTVKLLLRLRQQRLTALLGHDDSADPY